VVWECIWLTVRCKRSDDENDSDIFASDKNKAKFESVCVYFNDHSGFGMEQKSLLFDLLRVFMIAEGFVGPDIPAAD